MTTLFLFLIHLHLLLYYTTYIQYVYPYSTFLCLYIATRCKGYTNVCIYLFFPVSLKSFFSDLIASGTSLITTRGWQVLAAMATHLQVSLREAIPDIDERNTRERR